MAHSVETPMGFLFLGWFLIWARFFKLGGGFTPKRGISDLSNTTPREGGEAIAYDVPDAARSGVRVLGLCNSGEQGSSIPSELGGGVGLENRLEGPHLISSHWNSFRTRFSEEMGVNQICRNIV